MFQFCNEIDWTQNKGTRHQYNQKCYNSAALLFDSHSTYSQYFGVVSSYYNKKYMLMNSTIDKFPNLRQKQLNS